MSLWGIFMNNCTRYYTSHRDCTLDEQLLSFKGGCASRINMNAKPDKYGLKLLSLNDATTSYMIHAIPYLGIASTSIIPKRKIPELFL